MEEQAPSNGRNGPYRLIMAPWQDEQLARRERRICDDA
jgi:hypothetical protein